MRSVILGLGISLDGYIARPDGAVDFLFMPKDFTLVENKTFSKGLISLKYKRSRAKPRRKA
ncbi:MAG TPA: hypothetical protein VKY85_15975 [Candidatus Angelobacter sp.]|nr:hypothetical protein [Candidatus Angelobacter sp.]